MDQKKSHSGEPDNYKDITNYTYIESNIYSIGIYTMYKQRPKMEIFVQDRNLQGEFIGHVLIGYPQISRYYQKCLAESKKGRRGNPYFLLSNAALKAIKENFSNVDVVIPKATQAEINDLYNIFHSRITDALESASNQKTSLIIFIGEIHGYSLLQNLMVFERVKDSLKCLFLEQAESFLECSKSAEKYMLYNNNSFSYLSVLAEKLNIPVKCIENQAASDEHTKLPLFDESKRMASVHKRNSFMAENLLNHLPKLEKGTYIFLGGAGHLPDLEQKLKGKGDYTILSLDMRDFDNDFNIESDNLGDRKSLGFEDNLQLHTAVLIAKSACEQNQNSTYEVIDIAELTTEIKSEIKKGAYISDQSKLSKNPFNFFPHSKSVPDGLTAEKSELLQPRPRSQSL